MYTVTVNIASRGTQLSEGGTSSVGHMWYSLNDGLGGTSESFGFAPTEHGDPFGPGSTYNNDDTNYQDRAYTKTLEITQDQYNHLRDFGLNPDDHSFDMTYNGLTNSCIDFTWKALELAGLNPTGTEGALLPTANMSLLGAYLFGDFAYNADNHSTIPSDINGLFGEAQRFVPFRGDPLILDLDGDGIETIGIGTTNNVFFDTNGDGVKTATGWVGKDDGLLVLDRNGNATIDNGGELFGDQTLVNGVKATDGFAALSAEDTNNDGVFDANDSNYTNVRIWQDTNSDGISQSGELHALAEVGIASINLTATVTNKATNGGIQTAIGNYTKTDGSMGAIGNFVFTQDSFYRTFTDYIPINTTAQALPEMQGSGMVRDLREAMSMQTLDGVMLTELMTQYTAAVTRDQQMTLIDEMIKTWGNTSEFKDLSIRAEEHGYLFSTILDASQQAKVLTLEQFNGRGFWHMPWEDVGVQGTVIEANIWEDETGNNHIDIGWVPGMVLLDVAYDALKNSIYAGLVLQTRLSPYLDSINITLDDNGLIFNFDAMNIKLIALQNSDPLSALIDTLELLHYAGNTLMQSGWEGSTLLSDMLHDAEGLINTQALLNELNMAKIDTTPLLTTGRTVVGTFSEDTLYGSHSGDQLIGLDGNDKLMVFEGNNTLIGGRGDDTLIGGVGNDMYIFSNGDGHDIIYEDMTNSIDTLIFTKSINPNEVRVWRDQYNMYLGIDGTDDVVTVVNQYNSYTSSIDQVQFSDGTVWGNSVLNAAQFVGTDSNDIIYATMEDDVLQGLKGDDTIDGQDGNDTYIFNLGDGQDTIYDYHWGNDGRDIISFGVGIGIDDLSVTRNNYDLVVSIKGTQDSIRIVDWFSSSQYQIEEFVFNDGTTLTSQQIESMAVFIGTDGDDNLYGYELSDRFIGGKGNDILDGQDGNDTYIFNLGDGQDTIYDCGTSTTNGDILKFGEGITSDNLDVTRINNNLVLAILGTTDKITVSEYFMDTSSKVEEFAFADGTTLTSQQIESMVVLRGTDGNDTLYGYETNDVLVGTKGNDMLDGQDGDDTYIFNLGDGVDTIYDSSWNTNNKDIIRFGEGITSDNLDVTRINNNLVLAILGTTDKITVNDYFMGAYSKIEEFVFADGTTLTSQQIESMVAIRGTDGNDSLYGFETNDTYIFNLGDGQDTIYDSSWNSNNKDTIRFGEGISSDNLDVTRVNNNLIIAILGTTDKITVNDYFMGAYSKIEEFAFADGTTLTSQQIESMVVLRGTDGNDIINGSMESDTINGKKGDDQLYGDDGDDTYIFNLGDGQDTIYDSSWNTNNKDIIRFGEGITSDNLDVTRINNNLVLAILGTTDKITVSEYFMDTSSKVEEFAFADGTTLTSQQIESMVVLRGTDGNDIINGSMQSDTINGRKGDDKLYGNDGNDTYIFNLGDGADTIYDSSWNTNNKDIIRFGEGIVAADVTITQDQSNLYFTLNSSEDKIMIANYFDAPEYQIEQVTFTDGTLWNSTMFNQIL